MKRISIALAGFSIAVAGTGCDVLSPPPAPSYDYPSGPRYPGRAYPQGGGGGNPNSGYYDPRAENAPGGNRPYYPGSAGAPGTGPGTQPPSTPEPPRRDPLAELDPNSVNPDPSARSGTGATSPSTSGTTTPATPATPPPAPKPEYPVASRVPDKEGHVYSPFAPDKVVDVRDIPKGTKVYCPFTNKIFLVP